MSHQTAVSCVVALTIAVSVAGCSRPSSEAKSDISAAPASSPVPASSPAPSSPPLPDSAPAAASAPAPSSSFGISPTNPRHKTWDPQDETIKVAAKNTLALLQKRQHEPGMALTSVVSAESEIAAGLNLYLKLSLSTAKGPKTADVHVFRDLKNVYTLISVDGL